MALKLFRVCNFGFRSAEGHKTKDKDVHPSLLKTKIKIRKRNTVR